MAGRIEAWTTSWHVATTHPFAGEGFRALWNDDIWNEYYGYMTYGAVRDVHSLYFEVMSEHGFVGFGLYIAIMVSALLSLARVRRRWKGHPEYGHLAHYAEMNQVALYPFMVAGAFLSFARFDFYFLLVGTSVLLRVLSVRAEEAVAAVAPVASAPLAVRTRALNSRRSGNPPQARPHHA